MIYLALGRICHDCTSTIIKYLVSILIVFLQASIWAEDLDYEPVLPMGLDVSEYIVPNDNPMTDSKVEIGRLLYFDTRLSLDGTVSCAFCHSPRFAFTDGLKVSKGIKSQSGNRSAPTIVNRAFSDAQFWDGRAESLEAQVTGPMTNPIEMGMPSLEYVTEVVAGIRGYRVLFKKVFDREVNIEDIARAMASFERTILSGNAPYDRFQAGDTDAISESAKRGLKLFEDKARCNQCHSGPNFTDEKYHNVGVDWDGNTVDLGRYLVTGQAADIGAFKTPTLREIDLTGPYMHDGSLATLEETIEFYDKGGNRNPFLDVEMARPTRSLDMMLAMFEDKTNTSTELTPDEELAKLNLTSQDKVDLVNFLKALGGEGWQHIEPPDSFPE
jgi:cytochrome c peroxidase